MSDQSVSIPVTLKVRMRGIKFFRWILITLVIGRNASHGLSGTAVFFCFPR